MQYKKSIDSYAKKKRILANLPSGVEGTAYQIQYLPGINLNLEYKMTALEYGIRGKVILLRLALFQRPF